MAHKPSTIRTLDEIYYPSMDGKPIADDTLQFDYILLIKTNLDILYKSKNVFIAGTLLWYPVKGRPEIVGDPDVLVAYNRPKGNRFSYKQWQEESTPPSVVFEVCSKKVTIAEMSIRSAFYNEYGVQEFIIIDPHSNDFLVYTRQDEELQLMEISGREWVSDTMKIRIEKTEDQLLLYFPDDKLFRHPAEWHQLYCHLKNEKEPLSQLHPEQKLEDMILEQILEERDRLRACLEYYLPVKQYFTNLTLKIIARLSR